MAKKVILCTCRRNAQNEIQRLCMNCRAESVWAKYEDPHYYGFRVEPRLGSTLAGFARIKSLALTKKESDSIPHFKPEYTRDSFSF